jgi:hypothetical protein
MKEILFLISLIVLSGCASKKAVVVKMPRSVPGTVIPSDNLESIRYGENLKVYPVGRYVDPNNRLVMHEAHPVYRLETTAKWNLHPNAPVQVPGGSVVGLVDPSHRDSPITSEVAAEVQRQKAATQTLIEQGARIQQALSNLGQSVSNTKQLADENGRLREQVSLAEKRLDALEDQLRKQQSLSTSSSVHKESNDW